MSEGKNDDKESLLLSAVELKLVQLLPDQELNMTVPILFAVCLSVFMLPGPSFFLRDREMKLRVFVGCSLAADTVPKSFIFLLFSFLAACSTPFNNNRLRWWGVVVHLLCALDGRLKSTTVLPDDLMRSFFLMVVVVMMMMVMFHHQSRRLISVSQSFTHRLLISTLFRSKKILFLVVLCLIINFLKKTKRNERGVLKIEVLTSCNEDRC